MELMRKFINSPLVRRKGHGLAETVSSPMNEDLEPLGNTGSRKYFGQPLDQIIERDQTPVPVLVTKSCECICKKGLDQEGIFRVSGNVRVIEQLKAAVDNGIQDVFFDDEEVDVIAVAGLLKLFLRDLPDSLIPEVMVKEFIRVQFTYASDTDVYRVKMKSLLNTLPRPNYDTLKYIVSLLVLVAKNEAVNKMNPLSLGIVFGPNIFRSALSMQNFKEHGLSNVVVLRFITDFDHLFLNPEETPLNSDDFTLQIIRKEKIPPPRPPAPKIDRARDDETEDDLKLPTLCWSDEESVDTSRHASSPFYLDSDRSDFGSSMAPLTPPANSEVIDRTIRSVITERLFGGDSSSDEQSSPNDRPTPVPMPRQRKQDALPANVVSVGEPRPLPSSSNISGCGGEATGPKGYIKNQIKRNSSEMSTESDRNQSRKAGKMPRSRPKSNYELSLAVNAADDAGTLDDVVPSNGPLLRFTRPSGPKNRRPPSWPSFRSADDAVDISLGHDIPMTDLTSNAVDTSLPTKHRPTSPLTLLIPPLDLAALHVHENDNETAQAGKFLWMADEMSCPPPVPAKHSHDGAQNEALVSPSALHVTPYLSAHHDTDMPPSPVTHQQYVNSHNEAELRSQIKVLTKKIQTSKKKLKKFEEQFETQNGYRPSQSNKAANPEIKRCAKDLASARKELQRLKEELEQGRAMSSLQALTTSKHFTDAEGFGVGDSHLEEMCETLCGELQETRKEAGRPEDLRLMTGEQIRDEKTAVQKILLQFENLHGRPITKAEKEVMRPLYNRYRLVKQQLVARPASPRGRAQELQSVPEDRAIDFPLSQAANIPISDDLQEETMHIPHTTFSQDHFSDDTDFLVTKSNLTSLSSNSLQLESASLEVTGGYANASDTSPSQTYASSLHKLSTAELRAEKDKVAAEKRKLGRRLRQFEDNFLQLNGRNVDKEDRFPMNEEYKQYKQVKAKIRLLEVLLVKQRTS